MGPDSPSRSTSRAGAIVAIAGVVLISLALMINEWVLGAWLTIGGRVTNPASRLVLAAFDLVCVSAGLVLVVRRERAPWKQMLLSVVVTVCTLGLAEVGLRAVFAVQGWMNPQSRQVSATIGWRPVANQVFEFDVRGFGRVRYETTRGGFRRFGDPATSKLKVLVIGDSYTESATVSQDETFYDRIGQTRPDLEVFGIGGGGFGTLQEYMLLDEWVDVIRPDLVLLQMHPNDLINNSHALESRSTTDNNQMARPYWQDGRAIVRFPENEAWGPLYNLVRHSYLLRLINVNVVFLRARSAGSVEKSAAPDDPDVERAIVTTVELLRMMRTRAGAPLAVFSARSDDASRLWRVSDVARRAGVEFIGGVGEAVDAAQASGQPVTGLPYDAHWTARGHAIAAQVILEWMKTRGLPAR